MQRAAPTIVSVVILLSGILSFYLIRLYGAKDEVIYLWPLTVMLLMLSTACFLLYQAGKLGLAAVMGSGSTVRIKHAEAPIAD